MTSVQEQYHYELEDWSKDLQSFPIEEIKHADFSQSYEINTGYIFRLENGKFAFIIESGCSCYDPSWAKINIFENKVDAITKFDEWVANEKRLNTP